MNDEMRASAALAASINLKHPGLALPARENLARAEYPRWKEAWDARGMVDQLPDHAAPAAEPEPALVELEGWSKRLEELYQHVVHSPLAERRARFLGALKGAHQTMGDNVVEAEDEAEDEDEDDDAVGNTCRW